MVVLKAGQFGYFGRVQSLVEFNLAVGKRTETNWKVKLTMRNCPNFMVHFGNVLFKDCFRKMLDTAENSGSEVFLIFKMFLDDIVPP